MPLILAALTCGFAVARPEARQLRTLMHDPQYRLSIAWQNGAYNQPPHPGFFLGEGMTTPVPAENAPRP